jgi:hypothetical protein
MEHQERAETDPFRLWLLGIGAILFLPPIYFAATPPAWWHSHMLGVAEALGRRRGIPPNS